MDPLSITVGCVSLVGTIGQLSGQISSFVRDIRSARTELDAISRELLSLKTLLELLQEDADDKSDVSLPDTLKKQITGIIVNCNIVATEIQKVLSNHAGSKIDKAAKWAFNGKEDVNKLRLSLEAHKSALEIALEMVALTVTKRIESNTEELLEDTGAIKKDTEQILEEIARLRSQLPPESQTNEPNLVLNRYLNDMTSYAETVVAEEILWQEGSSPTRNSLDERNARDLQTRDESIEANDTRAPAQDDVDSVTNAVTQWAAQLSVRGASVSGQIPPSKGPIGYRFTWNLPANEVYATGTFDDWKLSVKLDKLGPNYFSKFVILEYNEPIFFKFVVDGNWTTNPTVQSESDEHGNTNNLILESELAPAESFAITLPKDVVPAVQTNSLHISEPALVEPPTEAQDVVLSESNFEQPYDRKAFNIALNGESSKMLWTADIPIPKDLYDKLEYTQTESTTVRYSALTGRPSDLLRLGNALRLNRSTEICVAVDMRRQSFKAERFNRRLILTLGGLMDDIANGSFSEEFSGRCNGLPWTGIVVCILMHPDREADVSWLRQMGVSFLWDIPPVFIEGRKRGVGHYYDDGHRTPRKLLGSEVKAVINEYTTTSHIKNWNDSAKPEIPPNPEIEHGCSPVKTILCLTTRGSFLDPDTDRWLIPISKRLDARLCISIFGGTPVSRGFLQNQWHNIKDDSKPSETGHDVKIMYVGYDDK